MVSMTINPTAFQNAYWPPGYIELYVSDLDDLGSLELNEGHNPN